MGLDPYLQDTKYDHRVKALTGYAAAIRSGYYGWGRQVTAATVSTALHWLDDRPGHRGKPHKAVGHGQQTPPTPSPNA